MRKLLQSLALAAVVSLGACSSVGNLTSIYRTPELASGDSLVLDGKQWVVLNVPRIEVNSDGTTSVSYITCSMPYPDALTAAAARGNLSLDNPGGTGGGGAFALSDNAMNIGLRTQSIQLLRDAMFRMCEAHAAGGLDALEYGVMMRRFQRNMIAILAIEQMTGVVATSGGAVSSTETTADLATLIEERRRLEAEQQRVDAARKATPAPTGQALADLNRTYDNLGRQISDLRAIIERETQQAANPRSSPAIVHRSTVLPTTVDRLAATVEQITGSAMNSNYENEMCFEFLRYNLTGDAVTPENRVAALNSVRARLPAAGQQITQTGTATERVAAITTFTDFCVRRLTAQGGQGAN